MTIKEIITSDEWIITKALQGLHKTVRIDAKRRFRKADAENFFSEWATTQYVNVLTREKYGKNIENFTCYNY